ncbi:NACHT domain-containing protein [Acaryochloris sp. CCMEE 5410]|uniref:NACHT domain-containing protein n=1 Tax=Acaryochloris sp. CCMEE 5410 TaxID=310037 RepID=UPI00024845C7|nr:NACHT domain-containing protein [Acaryochloris sp. CCMEE 5410]KAI9132176.1 NACHT domain-containing protein [Acaryochloris sp. CCMEE 5410]
MFDSGQYPDHENGRNHLTYGPVPRRRTKRLLEGLIAYANDEFEISEQLRSKIRVNWQTDYQLVVETTVQALVALTQADTYHGHLNNNQVKNSLKLLEKFLNILVDNRSQPRGSHKWNFTIKLWFNRYSTAENLGKFHDEWERLRPSKSKQVTDYGYNTSQSIPTLQGVTYSVAERNRTLNASLNYQSGPHSHQQCYFSTEEYLKRYSERHGILKVLGMRGPAQLDSLYTTMHLLNEDSVLSSESINWLEENYRQRKVFLREEKRAKRQSGLEIANTYQYLMVLGGPGTGKSTFLRKIGLETLNHRDQGGYQHNCIPVFIELKKFSFTEVDLESAIIEEFKICGFPKPQHFLEKALVQGNLLLLLDGLDEVPIEQMSEAISKIQDFANRFHQNRFIITCRPAAYKYNLRNFTDVVIAEFDDHQIRQFIEKWFHQQPQQGRKCWEQLNTDSNTAAKELTRTPLLLTMLCLVFQKEGQFPKHRATLYEKSLWVLLEEWDAEKDVPRESIYKGLAIKRKEIILSKIAFDAFQRDELFITRRTLTQQLEDLLSEMLPDVALIDGKKVLKSIELQHGLLVERVEAVYSFSHLTIQEFLAAQYIFAQSKHDDSLLQELIGEYLTDDRWQEIFLLLSGMSKADRILQIMAKHARSYVENSSALQKLLRCADLMTQNTEGDFKVAAKRATAIGLFFPGVHPLYAITRFANPEDANLKQKLYYTYDLARELTGTLTHKRLLTLALDRNRTTDTVMYCGIESTHKNAFLRAIKISIISAKKFKEAKIFNSVDFNKLVNDLESLKGDIPSGSAPFEENLVFAKRAQQIWINAFKVKFDLVSFSLEELDSLNHYLKAMIVIIHCQKSALSYSQSVWDNIESQILVADA